jgi:hypothetical protein
MNDRITVSWRNEVRERLEHAARNFPDGFEQQTVFNLLADQEALDLVCEPYFHLEPRLVVYRARHKLFLADQKWRRLRRRDATRQTAMYQC